MHSNQFQLIHQYIGLIISTDHSAGKPQKDDIFDVSFFIGTSYIKLFLVKGPFIVKRKMSLSCFIVKLYQVRTERLLIRNVFGMG